MSNLNTNGSVDTPSRTATRPIRRRALVLAMTLACAAQHARAEAPFRVGVMSGGGELLVEQVAIQAKALGLPLKIVAFSDYLLPNEALNHGELDANAFQHQPYLDNQIKTRSYRIVPVGWTIVAPIGLYSRKAKSPSDLPQGAKIGIPNDPSNGGRGLNLNFINAGAGTAEVIGYVRRTV